MDHDGSILTAEARSAPDSWFRGPSVVRNLHGLPAVLARIGPFELRMATRKREIRKAQRLRYKVFFGEGDAIADIGQAATGRDKCPFDRCCDHLLVVDTLHVGPRGIKDKVVGTTRLLRGEVAAASFGFYSETEFDVDALLDRHRQKRFLELGRSCVHPDYRSRRVIDLLWHGIGLYAAHHRIDVLIGCSSLAGTHAEALAVPLGFALHFAASPEPWQVRAIPPHAARMDWLDKSAIAPREAMATLPPLMKAYVRAGGTFSSQAALDYRFGTTDLFTVLPFADANPRYLAQFGPALARTTRAPVD